MPSDTSTGTVVSRFSDKSKALYGQPKRGRPELTPEQAVINKLRREAFGGYLSKLRSSLGLSVNEAAKAAGIVPLRKLAHYESNCYPPGDAIIKLAKLFEIDAKGLALEMIRHSEPDLYRALTGENGYKPSAAKIKSAIENYKKK